MQPTIISKKKHSATIQHISPTRQLTQLDTLAIENQRLTHELQITKFMLDRTKERKERYKEKYKQLKEQQQSRQYHHEYQNSNPHPHPNPNPNPHPQARPYPYGHLQTHPNPHRPGLLRENSGKIYIQSKSLPRIEIPTSRHPITRAPQELHQSVNYGSHWGNQYGIGPTVDASQLQRISDGVEAAVEMIKQLGSGYRLNQEHFSGFLSKMEKAQLHLCQQINQLKVSLTQMKSSRPNLTTSIEKQSQSFRCSKSNRSNRSKKSKRSKRESPEQDSDQSSEDQCVELDQQDHDMDGRVGGHRKREKEEMEGHEDNDNEDEDERDGDGDGDVDGDVDGDGDGDCDRSKESASTRSKWEMLKLLGKKLQNFRFQKQKQESNLLDSSERSKVRRQRR